MSNHDLEVLDQIESEVLNEEEEEVSEESLEKEAERKSKAEALWKAVQMGDDKHLTTRVANILNRYPESRNSDITLQIKYWQVYNGLTSNFVDLTKLYELERLTSISRARAKIQNEYKLFIADTEVRRRRRTLEDVEKEAQLLDKPSYGTINVFADETGKTERSAQRGLSVGAAPPFCTAFPAKSTAADLTLPHSFQQRSWRRACSARRAW